MNWCRTILDGLMMAVYFNLSAAVIVFFDPRIMMSSYPKSVQKAAPQPQSKRERRLYRIWMYACVLLPLLIYGTLSMVNSNIEGFWNMFFTAYAEWLIISFSDFFFLDIFLLQKMNRRMQIPGTYGHPDYGLKNWLKKLAIPEHFLGWPFFIAPLMSAVQAGMGMLCGCFI